MTANLLQGALFTMMVIRIGDPRDPDFAADLGRQIALSPQFFDNAPVVLDLKGSLAYLDPTEFEEAKALLRRHKLLAVGVQGATPAQARAAAAAGLGHFAAAGPSRRLVDGPPPAAAPRKTSAPTPAPVPNGGGKTRFIESPVRSGAQIYARGADLVIMQSVSPGAEIIADGHIHVYGTLRGRAIAGATGDTDARIFCTRLEAELISIAGRYLVSENIGAEWRGQPVQVALHDDRLTIAKT